MPNLYITADTVGAPTGGGSVTRHELEALATMGDVVVISQQELSNFGLDLGMTPFLADYFAGEIVQRIAAKGDPIRLAHIYSGTFNQTVRLLKMLGASISYTCPAHDRRITIEEHWLQGMPYPYPHISDDRLWPLFIGGVLLSDVVIAPSKLAANFLASQGCKNIVVIPHGCELPGTIAPFPGKFQVGYLGQVGPDKGVSYLLQAWARLNYQDSTLILAGPGTEQLGNYISRNVNGGKYHLAGFVPNVLDFYNSISVYVQPSVVESFGIEILEALAHGRPVIASEGAGASELVEDGKTGFVVPIRKPEAIAEKIAWFKGNPRKMVEMGQAAREKAGDVTWEKIKERYLEVWGRK